LRQILNVSRWAGTPVTVAYIGACTGAKLEDLRAAAEVLRGQRVANGVRLHSAFCSRLVEAAEQAGHAAADCVRLERGAGRLGLVAQPVRLDLRRLAVHEVCHPIYGR